MLVIRQYVHRCGRAGRNSSASPATVYSFFTRNFAPMAKDVLALLETSNAWIDPNLKELVASSTNTGDDKQDRRPTKKQRRERERETEKHPNKAGIDGEENDFVDGDEDYDEDDQFRNLNANRIVLQRASHVSDASSSDSESDDDSS